MGLLAFLVFVAFAPALRNDFLYWDDNIYTFQEPLVTDGAPTTLMKIFRSSHHGNYYPITLASFWIEYRIAGMTPAVYHLTNVLLHVINALLCFRLLRLIVGNMTLAWLAALLFAVHPLRVEAVAWISARKDLLAALFYLSAMIAYLRTSERRGIGGHLLVFVLHACALMSKGTAVTLPVALLLLDFQQRRPFSAALILEKVPLFALSIVFGLVAIHFQREIGATNSGLPSMTLYQRLSISSFAGLFYLGKTFIPTNLSAFYLYPLTEEFKLPSWFALLPLAIIPVLGVMLVLWRNHRTAFFGVAFFAVAIAPVLQFLSVGAAIAADRYTYLPGIGLTLAIVVLLDAVTRHARPLLLAVALLLIVPTTLRITVWRDTESLMSDQLRKFPTSVFAWNDRGVARMARGLLAEAYGDYSVALLLRPSDPDAADNLARAWLLLQGHGDSPVTTLTP